jgi:hypothetical protein
VPQAPKSFQQVLQELWELLKAYAVQETVGPLKDLGRQIGLGLAGALAFSLGYFLIVLGILRWLQFHGPGALQSSNWNFLTYLLACVLLGGGIFIAIRKVRGKNATVGPDPKKSGKPAVDAVAAGAPSPAADVNAQEPGR